MSSDAQRAALPAAPVIARSGRMPGAADLAAGAGIPPRGAPARASMSDGAPARAPSAGNASSPPPDAPPAGWLPPEIAQAIAAALEEYRTIGNDGIRDSAAGRGGGTAGRT